MSTDLKESPAFHVREATLYRGGLAVLREVNLTIDQGEVTAILGPNGSGKSTLLRAMIGILPLTRGSSAIMGTPTAKRRVHDALGYVPQNSAFSGNIAASARETVASGLLSSSRVRPRGGKALIDEALATVGLTHLADRPITEMSGGQRQRVMIARALVRKPSILVLDEPFTGVDSRTQADISELIGQLHAAGTTVVVVLHDLTPLRALITRAIVLDDGRIIHDGPMPKEDPHHDIAHSADEHHHQAAVISQCLGQELHP